MRFVNTLLAWVWPPWAFWRHWSALAAALGTAVWLGAMACAVLLWAGPGLVAWFVIATTAGALELTGRPAQPFARPSRSG